MKNRLSVLFLLLLLSGCADSESITQTPVSDNDPEKVVLSGIEVPLHDDTAFITQEAEEAGQADLDDAIILKVNTPLSSEQEKQLLNNGIKAIQYIGSNTYYLYGPSSILKEADTLLASARKTVKSTRSAATKAQFAPLRYQYKTSEAILQGRLNPWALAQDGDYLLIVTFLKDIPVQSIKTVLNQNGIEITNANDIGLGMVTVKIHPDMLEQLLKIPSVINVTETPPPFATFNVECAQKSNIDQIRNPGGGTLTGNGVFVQVVDGGRILETHEQLTGRVILKYTGATNYHATHVAGTIAADGSNQINALGMAPAAKLLSYEFNQLTWASRLTDAQGYTTPTYLSNHSYGYVYTPSTLGVYDSTSASVDAQIYSVPSFIAFVAAGNDQSTAISNGINPPYGIIMGAQNAKNVITIGALNEDGTTMSSFSSWGPVDDGRIKPDLVTVGVNVYSTYDTANNAYGTLQGTSMATPTATGGAALILQRYASLGNKISGANMRSDIIKSLLINTSVDKGPVGPDYQNGFGLIDYQAADTILQTLDAGANNEKIAISSVTNAETKAYAVAIPAGATYKATLCWIDPAGNPALPAKNLVNDLDLELQTTGGANVAYPYSLNGAAPTNAATATAANTKDNCEKVEYTNGTGSTQNQKITVTGSSVSGTQNFAIASSHALDTSSDVNAPVIVPAGPFNKTQAFAPFSFDVNASDADGDAITFTVSSNSSEIGVAVDPATPLATGSSNTGITLNITSVPTYFGTSTITVSAFSNLKSTLDTFDVAVTKNSATAPSNLTATAINSSSVLLQWTDNSNTPGDEEDGFVISKNGTTIFTTDGNVTVYTVTGLSASTSYTFAVQTTMNGILSPTVEATVTTPASSSGSSGGSSSDAGSGSGYPDPVSWKDIEYISGNDTSDSFSIKITWGGSWSSDVWFEIYYRGKKVLTTEPGARVAYLTVNNGIVTVSRTPQFVTGNYTSKSTQSKSLQASGTGDISICAINSAGSSCELIPLSDRSNLILFFAFGLIGFYFINRASKH